MCELIIEKVEVLVSNPGRNFVTTRITTDAGLTGLGDATLNGRELAVASYLQDHLGPTLIGRDPQRIEDTWQYLYRGAYWRRGPVTMAAIASIDMALWDIKGKIAGLPVYQLLGGRSRRSCLTYGHAAGRDVPELLDNVRRLQSLGYKAVRLQCAVPGMSSMYGVGPNTVAGTSPQRHLPDTEVWDTPKYLRFIPGVFEAARSEFGEDLLLLHDAHHRLRPIEGARLARDLEPYRLFWLEDVTPAENPEALRLVRKNSVTPLAIGEVFNSLWDIKTILDEQLVDYMRMSITHGGGITPVKKISEYAAVNQIRTAPHGPEDISPVGMSAAIHLGIAVHNFGIQEFANYTAETQAVFQPTYEFVNGALIPSELAGLGVSYDEHLAGKTSYEPSFLPVNRLADGTIHDW